MCFPRKNLSKNNKQKSEAEAQTGRSVYPHMTSQKALLATLTPDF